MNPEILHNIGQAIETENKRDRRNILFEKVQQISLVYVEKKFQELKKDHADYQLSQAIKDFSPLEDIILRPTFRLDGFKMDKYQASIDKFFQDFYQAVDHIYENSGFDLEQISNLANSKRDTIKKYLGVEDFKELDSDPNLETTKILAFNKINHPDKDASQKYNDLEKLGFSKHDHLIEIHVAEFYDTNEKNLSPELIRHDLAVVAEKIIDEEPEVAAVVGSSWLMSTALANRLGFKKIDDEKVKPDDFSTWLQFIDKDGQIDQKRLNQFSRTGEIPYPCVKSYMPTEEFLQKYLPASRRGKITLKEANIENQKFWFKAQAQLESVDSDWTSVLENHQSLDEFLETHEVLEEIFNLISLEDKAEYLEFLKTMRDNNIPWSQFYEHKRDNIEKIDKQIEAAIYDNIYKDKEVIIE